MRHPIYNELRMLTDNPYVIAAIETAAVSDTPKTFREGLYRATSVMPEPPKGRQVSRECFWGKFNAKFIWHTAWKGPEVRKDNAAQWLRELREAAQRGNHIWPPKPIFVPAATVPEPWEGKEEKPGRVPRK